MSPSKDPSATSPPPECPMHRKAAAAEEPPKPVAAAPPSTATETTQQRPPPQCPMHNKLNPDNNMPYLAQMPQPDQTIPLPTERVISSIPKARPAEGDDVGRWEYPSPQQFYNALRRKGWETPEDKIETMVDIHNWINEEAWNEVLKWEAEHSDTCCEPKLLRFQGRPNELSPKAWFMGWFGAPRPFDRHDWIIDRCGKEVRYVIDYYEGVDDVVNDVPVFHLDVRPALDSFESAFDRLKFGVRETFARFRKQEAETSASSSK
ncbi:holocytochrome c synthase [Actinomortierella wolfii]|nr:holocytochrome c synthase [Actinomortierella wolfii]